MKIGLYSVTYRGAWYQGAPLDLFDMMRLAKQQGWEGVEFDADRPHAAPMDLLPNDRKRLYDLAGELDLPIVAVSPNCDLSSPVPVYREAMICYVRDASSSPTICGLPSARYLPRGAALRSTTAWQHTTIRMDTISTAIGKAIVGGLWSKACEN